MKGGILGSEAKRDDQLGCSRIAARMAAIHPPWEKPSTPFWVSLHTLILSDTPCRRLCVRYSLGISHQMGRGQTCTRVCTSSTRQSLLISTSTPALRSRFSISQNMDDRGRFTSVLCLVRAREPPRPRRRLCRLLLLFSRSGRVEIRHVLVPWHVDFFHHDGRVEKDCLSVVVKYEGHLDR